MGAAHVRCLVRGTSPITITARSAKGGTARHKTRLDENRTLGLREVVEDGKHDMDIDRD